jgi:hypothetical protein
MKATCSSETSVDFQRTIWHYISEDRTLQVEYSHINSHDKLSGQFTRRQISKAVAILPSSSTSRKLFCHKENSHKASVQFPVLFMTENENKVDCKGFWRWCMTLGITGFLDFVHRLVFWRTLKNTAFRKLGLRLSSDEGVAVTYSVGSVRKRLRLALSNGPNRAGVSLPLTWGREQIQFPKRCVLQCSSDYRTIDKVQKPSNPEWKKGISRSDNQTIKDSIMRCWLHNQ